MAKKNTTFVAVKDLTLRRRCSAWILIMVFVPMLLLSSLHTHHAVDSHATECYDCIQHHQHHSHLTSSDTCIDSCVLCQMLTIPFLVTAAIVMAFASTTQTGVANAVNVLTSIGHSGHRYGRAPPVM